MLTGTRNDACAEGNAVVIAPQVAAEGVLRLLNGNARVKTSQLVLKIDLHPYRAARDQAAADLRMA